ncbi:MAG: hypothetical protein WCD66_05460, partial [Rhodanobacteraceae bacterium]
TIQSEYELLRDSPAKGARAILHRIGQRPLHFAAWYLFEKPRLLWGWRIRISQQDIYVYPTVDSPYVNQVAMRVLESLCKALNPLLALFALVAVIVVFVQAWRGPHGGRQQPATSQIVSLLLVFVTLVYTILQAEPRYSIPYRSLEILMGATGCYWLFGLFRRYRDGEAFTGVDLPVRHGSRSKSRGDQRSGQNTERLCGPYPG